METNNSFQFPTVNIEKLAEYFVIWEENLRRETPRRGTTWLHSLLYLAQAWHLAYFNTSLFKNTPVALPNGLRFKDEENGLELDTIFQKLQNKLQTPDWQNKSEQEIQQASLKALGLHWEQQAFLNDFLNRFDRKNNAELEILSKWDGLWEKYSDIPEGQIPADEIRQVYQQFLERQKVKKSLETPKN